MKLVIMEENGSFVECLLINGPLLMAFCTNLLAEDPCGIEAGPRCSQSVGNDCCYEGRSKRRCCSTVLTMIRVSSQAPALRT